jgi:hypothetical protein
MEEARETYISESVNQTRAFNKVGGRRSRNEEISEGDLVLAAKAGRFEMSRFITGGLV